VIFIYENLMLEPGDGRVTKPSLFAREALDPAVPRHRYSFFPMDHSILLCESHNSLTGNISFQNNLLNILRMRVHALINATSSYLRETLMCRLCEEQSDEAISKHMISKP